MGRPLNKKYFGNRNIGSTGTGDNYGIGGEGLAGISVATAGSFVVSNTYKNFPNLVIGAPNLPTGVQATADVVFEIDTVTYTSGGQTDGDYVAGLSTAITGLGGGAVVNIVETLSKVTSVDLVGGNRGEFRRGGAFDGTGITTFQVLQAPNAGTDLQISITFRVKSITIVEKGSGYTAVPSLSWNGHTFTGQTTPSGQTPTLTTDSGSVGSATNQENAITPSAWVNTQTDGDLNTTANGGSAVIGDIIKQVNGRVFKVKTAQGTGRCKLVAAAPAEPTVLGAQGEMTITATDQAGKTYYVTKITGRRAVLAPFGASGHQFPVNSDGTYKSAKWTFGAAVAPSGSEAGVVTIANA